MIGKEILSELGYGKVVSDIKPVKAHNMNCLQFTAEIMKDDGRGTGRQIPVRTTYQIAEEVIASKCKEWAWEEHCIEVRITRNENGFKAYLEHRFNLDLLGELENYNESVNCMRKTEAETIFEATQWIWENR